MDLHDGIIDSWANQAMDDLGEKSWRDVDTNSLLLIIYSVGQSKNRNLVKKVTRPLWWLLSVLSAGVIWWIISSIIAGI